LARPKGSILNQIRAEMIDMAHLYKNHHSVLAAIVIRGIKVAMPGGKGLKAYGRVDVRGRPDFSKCDLR
jgi:hypothetical protein